MSCCELHCIATTTTPRRLSRVHPLLLWWPPSELQRSEVYDGDVPGWTPLLTQAAGKPLTHHQSRNGVAGVALELSMGLWSRLHGKRKGGVPRSNTSRSIRKARRAAALRSAAAASGRRRANSADSPVANPRTRAPRQAFAQSGSMSDGEEAKASAKKALAAGAGGAGLAPVTGARASDDDAGSASLSDTDSTDWSTSSSDEVSLRRQRGPYRWVRGYHVALWTVVVFCTACLVRVTQWLWHPTAGH